jgi:trimethylamine--corrinoid protein Co-methyltransferase
LAFSAYRENSPGENFLGTEHTSENFENANFRSEMADNNSFEQWSEDGSKNAEERAYEKWNKMLVEYEQPPIDPAIDEELKDFIRQKKDSMDDEWY